MIKAATTSCTTYFLESFFRNTMKCLKELSRRKRTVYTELSPGVASCTWNVDNIATQQGLFNPSDRPETAVLPILQ